MNRKTIIAFVIVLVIILAGIVFVTSQSASNGPDLTAFAQCLKAKGATFYGAFWCPHCQATKRMFGTAKDQLPYVECSTPDASGQTQICIDKGIKEYPTWIFADGSRLSGELTLEQLAQKTGCQLPGAATSTSASIATTTSVGSSSEAVTNVQ